MAIDNSMIGDKSLPRTLRPSARPFIVFAVIFGTLALLCLVGHRPELAEIFAGLYVATMLLVSSVRVSVEQDGISIFRWYVFRQKILFEDIERSDVQYLAEGDWPMMITIHGKHRAGIIASIGFKAIRKEDANWFCSLEQLHVVVHPGFTKRPGL